MLRDGRRAHASILCAPGRQRRVFMKTIFLDCNDQLSPVWARVIRPDDPAIDVNRAAFARDDLPRIIRGYDIAIDDHSYMPTPLVAQCPELKHIVFLGTGPASYMNVGELEAHGIKVHIIKGYGDTAVAEHSIALMVAAARDVARMDREVRAGVWTPHEGVQLKGKTLGVIGLGGIGREVARIGKGMGMDVIGWNRTKHADIAVPLVGIDTLLSKSDVVSMNLTLGDETRGFLSAERIARMKPGVILVNTARGALVDEAALIVALKGGHIRHAGLDVFHAEPLKPNHPLAQLPNVTLTAHAAFRTLEASMTLLRRAVDIVKTLV
jgi:D-3-phosphoglycerate dehydrogenase / 2-oxoglutarate reductase